MTRIRLVTPIVFALAFVGDVDPAAALPDLVVTNVQVRTCTANLPGGKPYVVGEGCRIRVRARIKVRGDAAAGPSTVSILYEPGGKPGAGYYDGTPMPRIAGGTSRAVSIDSAGARALPPGNYKVGVCADTGDDVAERREGNNCRRLKQTLSVRACPSTLGWSRGNPRPSFTEDSGPALLLPHASVTGGHLSRATVRILDAGPGEQAIYVSPDFGKVSSPYDSGTGVLTLIGAGGAGTYTKALRSVWYENTGETPRNRAVVVRVTDRLGCSSTPASFHIHINRVNDAPRLDSGTKRRRYTPGGPPVVIDPFIALIDPDSKIKSATVKITSGFVSGEDQLTLEDPQGLSSNYDDTTGTLTIIGGAGGAGSLAFQSALRSVRFSTDSSSTVTRRIRFQVTDAEGATSSYFFANIVTDVAAATSSDFFPG